MGNERSSGLLRVLGVGFGIAIIIGNSIGIGILRMPGTVAAYLHSGGPIIIIWVLGGILSLIGAAIYAEASVAYPYSGGPYAISERVFGRRAGFTVGCCDWILNTSGNAALAIAASEYFISLTDLHLSRALLASLIILVFSLVQWFGMKSSSIIQNSLSVVKAVGLLFLVGAFFMHGRMDGAAGSAAGAPSYSLATLFGAMVLSMRAVFFTYAGWNAPIYFTEENQNPDTGIPRSLIWGVAGITFIYVLVNASLLYLMPVQAIADSHLAVADGARMVFGPSASLIVSIISIIIVLSGLYPSILYAPRIIFGMSRSGLFFPFASGINAHYIPGGALIASGVVAILFAATGTFEFVIAVTTFLYVFVDTSVYVAALYSRYYQKAPFPYHAPGYPVTNLFMITGNIIILSGIMAEDPIRSIYGATIILSTIPLYFIYRRVVHQEAG